MLIPMRLTGPASEPLRSPGPSLLVAAGLRTKSDKWVPGLTGWCCACLGLSEATDFGRIVDHPTHAVDDRSPRFALAGARSIHCTLWYDIYSPRLCAPGRPMDARPNVGPRGWSVLTAPGAKRVYRSFKSRIMLAYHLTNKQRRQLLLGQELAQQRTALHSAKWQAKRLTPEIFGERICVPRVSSNATRAGVFERACFVKKKPVLGA
jgi:hypothetical protein